MTYLELLAILCGMAAVALATVMDVYQADSSLYYQTLLFLGITTIGLAMLSENKRAQLRFAALMRLREMSAEDKKKMRKEKQDNENETESSK